MKIYVTSVFVDDQAKALKFYTEKLGFIKKQDIPLGEASWLTVVSPENPDGVELLLEPDGNPVSKTYKAGLVEQGIPATSFMVDDLQAEYEKLKNSGVEFTMEPTNMGTVIAAVLDDTCGNLIQLVQML